MRIFEQSMHGVKSFVNIFVIFLLLQSSVVSMASDKLVDPSRAIPLFLKIITYDDNFDSDSINAVNVFFIYDGKQVESYRQLKLAKEYFESNRGIKVSEKNVSFRPITIGEIDSNLNVTSDTAYNIVIVTELKKNQLINIKEKMSVLNIRSFTLNPDHVKWGYSVSVKLHDRRTKIVVNLEASHLEGSEYSAHLLKMCDIYKN